MRRTSTSHRRVPFGVWADRFGWLGFLAACALVFFCAGCTEDGTRSKPIRPESVREVLGFEGGFSMFPTPVTLASGFRCAVQEDLALGRRTVRLEYSEEDPDSGEWHEYRRELATPYWITALSGTPSGRDFVVAGIHRDSTVEIERLSLRPRAGGPRVDIARPGRPSLGVPAGPLVTTYVPAETYVPPLAGASGLGDELRSRVWAGEPLRMVRCLALDPELRYVACVDLDGRLWQIDLTGATPAPPVQVFDREDCLDLERVAQAEFRELAEGGRWLFLSTAAGHVVPEDYREVVVRDADNDGVFESIQSFTSAESDAAGLGDSAMWRSIRRVDHDGGW